MLYFFIVVVAVGMIILVPFSFSRDKVSSVTSHIGLTIGSVLLACAAYKLDKPIAVVVWCVITIVEAIVLIVRITKPQK